MYSFKHQLILLLFPIYSFGQTQVSGFVKSSNETLIGVTIWLKNPSSGKNVGASSDVDGKFTFQNIAPGKYSLSSSYVGYKEYVQANIVVGADPVIVNIESKEVIISQSFKLLI